MADFNKDLKPSEDRGDLLTEQANPLSQHLDQLDTPSLVGLFIEEIDVRNKPWRVHRQRCPLRSMRSPSA